MHLAIYRKLKIHRSCEQNVKFQRAGCEPLPKLQKCHKHPLHNYISNIYCMSHQSLHVCHINAIPIIYIHKHITDTQVLHTCNRYVVLVRE